MMKSLAIAFALVLTTYFAGCINLYTRCPGTDIRIRSPYQCTEQAACISLVVAFPQIMGSGNEKSFIWENLVTIPFGLLGLCDTACEVVLDTVCLPYDWPVSNYRNNHPK